MPPLTHLLSLRLFDVKKKGGVTAAGMENCVEACTGPHVLSHMHCKSVNSMNAHGEDNECSVRVTPPLGVGSFLFGCS